MLAAVDECFLGDGIAAPEEEDEAAATAGELADGGIGEEFPSMTLMTAGLVGTDGEGGVEEQYPLLGPAAEVAA